MIKLKGVLVFSLLILLLACKKNDINSSPIEDKSYNLVSLEFTEEISIECIDKSSLLDSLLKVEIDIHLKLQKNIELEGISNLDQLYKMTDKDVNLAGKLIFEVLKKNGFKALSIEDFRKRIAEDFNLINMDTDSLIKMHDGFFVRLIPQYDKFDPYLADSEYDYTYDHIFFLKEYGIITYIPYLTDLLLDESKVCISDTQLHRNKFLFNDSNASLTWLINNDIEFLEILLREFGYDKNDKLNKAVLQKICSEYFGESDPSKRKFPLNIFAKKLANGELKVNENLMKFISENYDKQDNTPIELLNSYGSYLSELDKNYDGALDSYTREERYKLAAYAGYYEVVVRKKYDIDVPGASYYERPPKGWNPGSFLRNQLVGDKELLEAIKKNNYYNLPGFEDIITTILNTIEVQSEEYKRTHNF